MRHLYSQWYSYPDGLQHKAYIEWDAEVRKLVDTHNFYYERLACGGIVAMSVMQAEHQPKCLECLAVETMYLLGA